MKKIIAFFFLVFFVGCSACIQFPRRAIDKKGNPVYPESCYRYEICMYYVATGKLQSNCNLELAQCRKDTIYSDCRAKAFRWDNTQEQQCWDKLD